MGWGLQLGVALCHKGSAKGLSARVMQDFYPGQKRSRRRLKRQSLEKVTNARSAHQEKHLLKSVSNTNKYAVGHSTRKQPTAYFMEQARLLNI